MATLGKAARKVNAVDVSRPEALDAAIELMHFGYRAMIAGPDRLLRRRALTRVHHRVLHFVARAPGTSVNALLRTLGVSKQALHAPLRTLTARGLVVHARSPRDARVKALSLTPAGRRLEASLSRLQRTQFAGVFAHVGARDEAGWRRVMTVLAARELAAARHTLPGTARRSRGT